MAGTCRHFQAEAREGEEAADLSAPLLGFEAPTEFANALPVVVRPRPALRDELRRATRRRNSIAPDASVRYTDNAAPQYRQLVDDETWTLPPAR